MKNKPNELKGLTDEQIYELARLGLRVREQRRKANRKRAALLKAAKAANLKIDE